MLKNERLVYAMTPEERIKLITGVELYKSRSMGGYDFPVVRLSADPMEKRGARVTAFPCDGALASTWNPALVRNVYKCIGNEAKATVENAYYKVTDCLDETSASCEAYAQGKLLSAKVQGLNASGAFVHFADEAGEDDDKTVAKLLTDLVFEQGEPDSASSADPQVLSGYAAYRFGRLKFGVASTKEEVARFLVEGCSFVYLTSDFTDTLIPYLLELTVAYDQAFASVKHGKMTPEQLDAECRLLHVLPMAHIDAACDRIIEMSATLVNNNADSVAERKLSLAEGVKAAFDEPLHDGLALSAARESIILLKNDGILPLKHESRAAVLGEYAKDPSYMDTGNAPTFAGLPFEVINDYEIQAVGFAYGYRRGETGRTDLLNTARKLCMQADVALVYLCAGEGATALPAEQLQLIDYLADRTVKIIAVVAADGPIDMSFADRCNAVLLTDRACQRTADAVFEIVTGFVNPSGKLARSIPLCRGGEPVADQTLFPVGFGLSYTTFTYTNLKLDDRGVSLTVANTGDCDGYSTVQLYVKKKDASGGAVLRGFEKVFVKKNDSVKVEIRFGAETFRIYDESRKKYAVEGGDYLVYIGESAAQFKLEGELTLSPHVFDEETFTSKGLEYDDAEAAFDAFTDTVEKRAFYSRGHDNWYALKVTLALLLAAYCDITAALLILTKVIPDSLFWLIGAIVLALAVTLGVLVYILVITKKRNVLRASPPAPLLGDVVADLGEFKELAHVSYETPIPASEVEEEETEQEETAQTETVEEVRSYDTAFTEGDRQNIAYRENVSFHELCVNFHDYARSKGVEIEASSVRELFAALAASKLILVDIKNKEALPAFLSALGGYFHDVETVDAGENWSRPEDLMWTQDGDKYVASGFVNAVYAAAHTPDMNAVAVVNRVRPETMKDYANAMIRHAMFPSEEHVWTLNETTSVILPRNIRYVMVTEDGFGNLPLEIAAASVQIELLCSSVEPSAQTVEIKSVSYKAFEDLVTDAREAHFLPESVWKKLDELVEVIQATERFAIGNKTVLQLERLTSVLLECGADESDALVAMLTDKLIGRLKNLDMYKRDGGERTVFGILEKLFADENMTKVRKALAKAA